MGDNIRSQAINGVKWSSFSKVFTSIVQVLQVAILTRFLAKEDFGLIGIAVLVNTFCGIFADMGMSVAAMHEKKLSKETFSSFYWFNLCLGFLLFMLVSLCSPLIADFYNREELVGIITFTSLSIFTNSISSLQKTIQQKQMNFKFMSIVEMTSSSCMLISNTVFVLLEWGVYSLVISSLLGSCITAIAYLAISFIKEKNILFHFHFKDIRDALNIGFYQVGTSCLDFFSREMDSFIVSSNMSMELFGIYTLCKNLTSRIYHVINPILINVLTPIMVKIQDDKEHLTQTYKRSIEVLGYINFPIYSVVAITSYSLLTLLYGASYKDYSLIMACLAVFYAFQSCGNPIGSLLVATGRTDRGFYWTIFRIFFVFCFLYYASQFNLVVFSVLLMLVPTLTSYPFWRIILKEISSMDFRTSFMLPIKPLLSCVPLYFLYFIDGAMNSPVLSIIIIGVFFFVGYYIINRLFRPNLQSYILNIMANTIGKR